MLGDYVPTEKVLADLEALRKGLCVYGPTATRCDCKFLREEGRRIGEESGCCEVRQAIHHIEVLAKGVEPWPRGAVNAALMSAGAAIDRAIGVVRQGDDPDQD